MDKRIDDIRLFKQLVSEINIRRYEQAEFVKVVESIYEEIFEALQPR
jgi:hypothetical protein